MKVFLAGAAVAAMTFATPAAAATQIFFEDFENVKDANGNTIGATGTGFTNVSTAGPWKAGSAANQKIELQFGNVAGAPANPDGGKVFVELDTTGNNSMFYTLGTSGNYTLDFLYSPRPDVVALSNIIQLWVGGSLLASVTGPVSGTNSTTIWTQQSFVFNGLAGDILELKAAGDSDRLGGYVDNTRLTLNSAVPEPGTWLLMILRTWCSGLCNEATSESRRAFSICLNAKLNCRMLRGPTNRLVPFFFPRA